MKRASTKFRHGLRIAIAVGMLVAVVVNLVQFRSIDDGTRHNYKALHGYGTWDIFEIAIASDNSARQRVAPFYYLGKLFPESRIIVPTSGINSWFNFDESAFAFGRVSKIDRVPYDPQTLLSLEGLLRYRIPASSFAPGEGAAQRVIDERVAYVAPPEPSGTFIVITPDGRPGRTGLFAFVDIILLDEDLRIELGIR